MYLCVIGVVALIVAGCGASDSTSGSADDVAAAEARPVSIDDVASLLTSAGLGCRDLQKPPKAEWNIGTESAVGVGECTVEGESAEFILFENKKSMETYFSVAKKIACEFGKAFGISEFDLVTADTWVAEGISKRVAEAIASATGGEPHHVIC